MLFASKLKTSLLFSLFWVVFISTAYSQTSDSLTTLPSRYFNNISSKTSSLNQKLDKKSDKAIEQLSKREEKIRRKLERIDSNKAKEIFGDANQKYQQLQQKLCNPGKLTHYIPYLDTLKTSFKFLEQNNFTGTATKEFTDAFSKVIELESKLQKADDVKQFLKERREYLKQQLENLGLAKDLKKINKQVYYYSAQVNEYKAMIHDKKRMEKKAIELLSKTKLFQDFMQKNSMLASLFHLNGDPNDPANQASLVGLQTRTQVNGLIQQQLASGGPNAQSMMQQNLQQAQSQLQTLKNKITQFGGSSSEDEIPDFKPNNQKTKSFLQRLELGSNFQTQKSSAYFPVTSDIGLSVGYKLNDKSVIGIGASYKLGWGQGWNNMHMSSEGVGLRSYVDVKLKGSFFVSGGYEQNYRTSFTSVQQLKEYSAWQQSGLIGLSKIVNVKSKLFKKTKLQLLFDFLSYQQLPRTQPIIFRLGYNF
jgi:CII-binding regulator of phage lambda lysogenization HflD